MTDITELAQREKFEAWAEERCALPWGYLKNRRTNTGYFSKHDYTNLWAAWKAAGAELVEALEKAQADGNEYAASERAVAVKNVELQDEIYGLKARIADLEESNAQVIQSRDHYKRMTEEGLKQLAESRTVTVKLPRPGFITISGERMAVYMKGEVVAALLAAGIKWEAE
ncbi:ead/Ea22-like family protein [Klebsiella michiganensis]|jgi:hypothetical protein|uniref:ead/Ea22-like family protein n=1 Tax=Klebsiella michiganensis TaxID=1134687 RepID=UPI001CCBFCD1|nr:ead/Ea22-like family protein [Klebsiella michiganensis]